jgi:hypothetical protein
MTGLRVMFAINHQPTSIDFGKTGALTRTCAGLSRLPSERIAANALRANEWLARGDPAKRDGLILSQVGLLFPVNHALEMMSLAVPRLRDPAISCMRGRHID